MSKSLCRWNTHICRIVLVGALIGTTSMTASAETVDDSLDIGHLLLTSAQQMLAQYRTQRTMAPVPQPPADMLGGVEALIDRALTSAVSFDPVESATHLSIATAHDRSGIQHTTLHNGAQPRDGNRVLQLTDTLAELRLVVWKNAWDSEELPHQLRLPKGRFGWIGGITFDNTAGHYDSQALLIGEIGESSRPGTETYWLRRPYDPELTNAGNRSQLVAASMATQPAAEHEIVVVRHIQSEFLGSPIPGHNVRAFSLPSTLFPIHRTELVRLAQILGSTQEAYLRPAGLWNAQLANLGNQRRRRCAR